MIRDWSNLIDYNWKFDTKRKRERNDKKSSIRRKEKKDDELGISWSKQENIGSE